MNRPVRHDFASSLAASHKAADWPGWEQLYRDAFPDFDGMHDHRQDGYHQREGIDRSITLKHSKQILIDEKVRSTDYPDILLEYISNNKTNAPGWVCKPLRADYIAYLVAPGGRAYLLPVPQLQEAWRRNRCIWFAQYDIKRALNKGYVTMNLPIPVDVLFFAMGKCLRLKFEPFEVADEGQEEEL